MTLLELARKWWRPSASDLSAEDQAERDEFKRRSEELWLAYHDDAPWAHQKLRAGLVLTPEALEYMEREVTARKLAAEARKKNLETKDAEHVATPPTGDDQPHGAPPGNGGGADGGDQATDRRLDSGEPAPGEGAGSPGGGSETQ